MTLDIEKVETLIAGSKASEALQLAERIWRPSVEKTSLGIDELRLLVIVGTLLNKQGDQKQALGYLSRFHLEYKSQPKLSGSPHLYEWGELLYLGVVEAVTLSLQQHHGQQDTRDQLVEKDLAKLSTAQMSKAQAKTEEKKFHKAPSASADRKAKGAKAAQAASGGGCGVVMAIALSGGTVFLGVLLIAIHVLR